LLEEASARGFADADAWRISARIEAIRGALASGDASGSVSVAPAR
jgi:hypothetical protein